MLYRKNANTPGHYILRVFYTTTKQQGEELIKLYREKGTVDIEQIEWVKATLEKYK